jgi:hypothetical protein
MSYEFQLYRKSEDNFPVEMEIYGVLYAINADFRTVLRIYKIFEQYDVSVELRNKKAIELFFGKLYPKDEPMKYFEYFVNKGASKDEENDDKPPEMCMFLDADVIYTSFRMQYGIDLINIPFLHWYEYLMLLSGLGENTPLRGRIRIRTWDTKNLKGKDLADALELKKKYAIPKKERPWTDI